MNVDSEYIVRLRKSMNLTQEEFGDLIGVSKNTVYNYENGAKIPDTKIPILVKLAKESNVNTNNEVTDNDPYIDALTEKLFSSEKFKKKLKEEQKQISSEELIAIVLKYLKEVD